MSQKAEPNTDEKQPDAANISDAEKTNIVLMNERARLTEHMVKLKLVDEDEAAAAGFDPITAAMHQLVTLKRNATAEKAQKTRARNEVHVLQSRSKPRKLGPVNKQLKVEELAELLADEDEVEIAFSDGKEEIVGLRAVAVSGSQFAFRNRRLSLNVPDLTVTGPADERGARALAGYALLIEGKQIAWLPRLDGQLTLGAGQSYQLKDDVTLV